MSAPGLVPLTPPYECQIPWGPGQQIAGQVTGLRTLYMPPADARGPIDPRGRPYVRDVALQVSTPQGVLELWVAGGDLLLMSAPGQITARRPLMPGEREDLRLFYQDTILVHMGGFPRPADLALRLGQAPTPELPPAAPLAAGRASVGAPAPDSQRW